MRAHSRQLKPPAPKLSLDPVTAILPAYKIKTVTSLNTHQLPQIGLQFLSITRENDRGYPRLQPLDCKRRTIARPPEGKCVTQLIGAIRFIVDNQAQF